VWKQAVAKVSDTPRCRTRQACDSDPKAQIESREKGKTLDQRKRLAPTNGQPIPL